MTLVNEDVDRILQYLTSDDQNLNGLSTKPGKMDIFHQDGLLSESWQASSDELLENIFSLDHGSLDFLEQAMPDFDLCGDTSQPSDVTGSSCSDSGLSSDQAEFDFEQQLSPFLIQNSCDDGAGAASEVVVGACDVAGSPCDVFGSPCDVVGSPCDIADEPVDMLHFEQDIVPSFINKDAYRNPGKGRKRRLSQTPQAIVQPKVQKQTLKVTSLPVTPKPQLIVKAQPHKPLKVANIQVLNPQTKVYCKPMDNTPHRKIIRVSPMAGNPRSILLPVTIKDMKDLKSIKIINASDLKNASNIKLAAANLLSQSKLHDIKIESNADYEYGNNNDDSGSEHSDDDDSDKGGREGQPTANGYPRLLLTAEERKLLAKEGIALPGSYPLTKHEERELKRIRRKIRNKISAQDSRKRKKEYVDGLEDRVKKCTTDNQTLMRRIKILQSQNHSLTAQLKRLQSVLTGVSAGGANFGKSTQPATCLLVLLLSVALVALPSMRDDQPLRRATEQPSAPATTTATAHTPTALRRALLSATMSPDETVIDEGEFSMEELITFRAPHDHDYPRIASPVTLPTPAYRDLPIDEDWPPHLKRRIKTPHFDYGDGSDYLPPIIKHGNYENIQKIDLSKLASGLFDSTILSATRKLGELIDFSPPIPVKTEDILIEEVDHYDIRNMSEVRSFVVNNI